MQSEKWEEVGSEPNKGTPLYVLGEVLKAYKNNMIQQSHQPFEFEGKEAKRNHDALMKRLEYQLGYALHSSLVALRIPNDGWQWYLDLVQKYAAQVNADFSNCRQVAGDAYEVIKSCRGKSPANAGVVTEAVDIEGIGEPGLYNFDNYVY